MRLALNVEEACAALGVSWDFWAEYVAPEVRSFGADGGS